MVPLKEYPSSTINIGTARIVHGGPNHTQLQLKEKAHGKLSAAKRTDSSAMSHNAVAEMHEASASGSANRIRHMGAAERLKPRGLMSLR